MTALPKLITVLFSVLKCKPQKWDIAIKLRLFRVY